MNFFVFLFVVLLFVYVMPRLGRKSCGTDDAVNPVRDRELSHLRERVATLERVVIDRDYSLRRDIDRLG